MPHLPDRATFATLAAQYDLVPVYRRLIGDPLTPVSAFARLDDGGYACLFESVIGGEKVGRYSFLGVHPSEILSASGNCLTITNPNETGDAATRTIETEDPLDELAARLKSRTVATLPDLPPFTGGAVGYAGYDVVRYVEELPDAPTDDRDLPDLSFAFFDQIVVFDNVTKTVIVVVLADTSAVNASKSEAAEELRQAAVARVDALVDRLSAPCDRLQLGDIQTAGDVSLDTVSNFTQEDFQAAVRRCVEYIRAGDIFQVVISQRLTATLDCDPLEVYRTLRIVNPSPFMFFLRTPECTLVGSSPEIMVRVVDGKVTVRPLAGTRPRGADDAEDARLGAELLADEKELAEHVMLVDLGRNDVGRVAKYRSVELSDVMVIERYSHVMHITSNVTGQLRDDCDAFDALRACLPAGTVSGAPKVRAMQIIDEIEPHRRGPYAGAVGYIDYNGNMDTCIALRTMVIQGERAYVQAGAGIVADSDPITEYEETLNKARGLLKAIEITTARQKDTN